ncbi:DUF4105 domain-containing protein [Porphyromonas sp.]|uniref:lipoprotein N-acyltransferase Lnb domain-containing protein n=1 Tax=Porphyromonas sp. TaxID=1924944 RepID=UPI0026DD58DE|nr:DUF4105 domain-containing protein [Porphyromonas sp.]MDO4695275.1 DUF4105 domain-containing protein [Porphyromonas sp.]MDO4770687.1 DUF4105 domain-containing protein [Porphyromonas sp.]
MKKYLHILYLLSVMWGMGLTSIEKAIAQNDTIPQRYRVSLVTCGPSDLAPFLLYGHSAIRVKDLSKGTDLVFNYGLFSFDQPSFLMNFALGKPIYALGIEPMETFLTNYVYEGRSVSEQVLNLKYNESEALLNFLLWNAQPEQRNYIYNFYFDNCSTKARDLIEKYCGGFSVKGLENFPTFRNAIRSYTATDRWYTLLCDLPLGMQTDKQMSLSDAAFLPLMLEKELDAAVRKDNNEPLVIEKILIAAETRPIGTRKDFPISPSTVVIGILLVYAVLVLLKSKAPYALQVYRSIMFLVIGVCGILLWFLGLISHHPHTFPNLNMLLFTPLYILLAITLWFSKCKRINNWLYFINFVGIFSCAIGVVSGLQNLPEGITLLFGLILIDHAIFSGALDYIKSKRK